MRLSPAQTSTGRPLNWVRRATQPVVPAVDIVNAGISGDRPPQHTRQIDATNRRYGETGANEKVQLDADRKRFPIAPARRPRLKAIIYLADGFIARVRAVPSGQTWRSGTPTTAATPMSLLARIFRRVLAGDRHRARRVFAG